MKPVKPLNAFEERLLYRMVGTLFKTHCLQLDPEGREVNVALADFLNHFRAEETRALVTQQGLSVHDLEYKEAKALIDAAATDMFEHLKVGPLEAP